MVRGRLGRTAGTNGKSYLGHPSEGAYSGFGSSALPHEDLAGISAAYGCWDNSSGQPQFSKCAYISVLQHTNHGWIKGFARAELKVHIGCLEKAQEQLSIPGNCSFYYSCSTV